MMKWRLRELIGEYQAHPGDRLTYRELAKSTGLSKTTVYSMANNKMQRADIKTMNTLLNYMSTHLERPLTTDDLLHFEADG